MLSERSFVTFRAMRPVEHNPDVSRANSALCFETQIRDDASTVQYVDSKSTTVAAPIKMRPESRTAKGYFAAPASSRVQGVAGRTLTACLMLLISACASMEPEPRTTPDVVVPAPEPAPVPVEPALSQPSPPVTEVPEPEPEPQPAEPLPGRIAIVLSDRTPAYENVALELGHLLDDFLLYNLADKSLSPEAAFAAITDSDAKVVIAIGLRATEQAIRLSTVPVVFCQVFNIDVTDAAVPVKGVASIPPLSLQIKAWKQLDPKLDDIGAILGAGHDDLIAEAERATAANDIDLHYRIAASDRETLYIFNRMAPEIDGFWLFPDNRVLSVSILREMLSYASSHNVQVAVFNAALLDMGATLSATTVDSDIAATTVAIADRIIRGDTEAIPLMTLLHEVDVQTDSRSNTGAAAKGMP